MSIQSRAPRAAEIKRPAAPSQPSPLARAGTQSGGQALDRHTQASMSARFGHDFSNVRVHTDARAVESADALGANAFAHGPDIVFGAGRYTPGSPETERLLAHELTHVVQQSRFGPGDWSRMSSPEDASEREADALASSLSAGRKVDVKAAPGAAIARDADEDRQKQAILDNPLTAPYEMMRMKMGLPPGDEAPEADPGIELMGEKPGDHGGPYGYAEIRDHGISMNAGLAHDHSEGRDWDTTTDIGYANASMGEFDEDGGTRYGMRMNAGGADMTGHYGPVSGEVQAFTAGAEASAGDDGATLGGGATIVGASGTFKDKHESSRFGLSAGPSLAGRLHWGKDQDGFRNYGAGADFGPFSVDYTTNDPVRSLTGPLKYLLPDDENLTEDAANLFGRSIRSVDVDTKAQARAQAVMNRNADARIQSETQSDLYGSSTSVAHEQVPPAPIQMVSPDKDPWR